MLIYSLLEDVKFELKGYEVASDVMETMRRKSYVYVMSYVSPTDIVIASHEIWEIPLFRRRCAMCAEALRLKIKKYW